MRIADRHGNTVEPAVIDGRAVFIPRSPQGIVLGQVRGVDIPLPTTAVELEQLGIDLDSLPL
jgi:hypothetical protein